MAVRTLIAEAMNQEEADWAETTMCRHFELERLGVFDGRHYFVRREGGVIKGVIGLHHYEWGPKENVWLGWFAVAPSFQGLGIGKGLLESIQEQASQLGYRKMFIETYSSPTFARARDFYSRRGFRAAGRIADYLSDGSEMIVFSKRLA
jgi:GNAT superfamily N-acetyltransferase